MNATQELRVRAEILHRRIQSGDPGAIQRLRALPDFSRAPVERLRAAAPGIRRGDCLALLARELGFPDWPLAKRALEGDPAASDFGTLLWSTRCTGHLNLWFKTYDEAATVREQTGRYLLAYRHQFVVVDRYYIETLGLDPDDPDWNALGLDWVHPRDPQARSRLYRKLVANLPREAAASGGDDAGGLQ